MCYKGRYIATIIWGHAFVTKLVRKHQRPFRRLRHLLMLQIVPGSQLMSVSHSVFVGTVHISHVLFPRVACHSVNWISFFALPCTIAGVHAVFPMLCTLNSAADLLRKILVPWKLYDMRIIFSAAQMDPWNANFKNGKKKLKLGFFMYVQVSHTTEATLHRFNFQQLWWKQNTIHWLTN